MGQGTSEIRFPLRYKLLLSTLALILLLIGFLTVSTTILLREDKRTYTYLIQGTEAELAGKEVLNRGTRAIDSMRQILSNADLFSIRPDDKSLLQTIVENQPAILGMDLVLLNQSTGETKRVAQAQNAGALSKASNKAEDLHFEQDWIYVNLGDLKRDSYAWINLARAGSPPVVALILADLKSKRENWFPAAISFLPMGNFSKSIKGSSITVVTPLGWVIFDSDPAVLVARKNIQGDPLLDFAKKSGVQNASQQYVADGKEYLGSFTSPGLSLTVLSKNELRKAMGPFYALLEKIFVLSLAAISIAILFAVLFSKRLTDPIKKLLEATKKVAAGDFNIQLKSKSRDEVGTLSESFSIMSQKINTLIKDSVEKTRIEGELAIASTVQKNLFPPPKFQNERILLRSFYQSASECGGDWWGLLTTRSKIGIFIADATGHGIPSALVTASARSCFSVIQKLAQDDPKFQISPSNFLSYANRSIYEASSGTIMMTFFAAVFDYETNLLTYSSAGHNPPWLFQKVGDQYAMKSLTARGVRLGETRDSKRFEEKSVKIKPEDILFFYTDGIIEGTNKAGVQYGKKQLKKTVESALHEGPENILSKLVNDFSRHNEQKPLDDDVTLTAVKIL